MPTLEQTASVDHGSDRELMARYGIAVVRADQYRVDGYRYTNLADAIAQAGRRAASSGADR